MRIDIDAIDQGESVVVHARDLVELVEANLSRRAHLIKRFTARSNERSLH